MHTRPINPTRVWLLILCVVFIVEALVMAVLPIVVPANTHDHIVALIDACLLTGTISPLVWLIIVRPLERLATMRAVLLARVYTIQEDERRRLAIELHDSIGQSLSSLVLGLSAMSKTVEVESWHEHAQNFREVAKAALDEVRRLAHGLHPSVLDDFGLVSAIRWHTAEFAKLHGITIELIMADVPDRRLPAAIELALYRIVQEALNNVAKHSGASKVVIRLAISANEVELTVKDNGCGFQRSTGWTAEALPQLGLAGMRERAMILGGEAHIDSQPGAGTSLTVRIPLLIESHGENTSVGG